MKRPLRSVIFTAIACAAGACTTTTVVEPFYRPPSAQVDYAFVSPDADFGRYRRLQTTPLEIYYPDDAPQPPAADVERLRSYFREAFLTALGEDYVLTTEPAPDALRVQAQIIDLKLTGAEGSYEPGRRLREVVANGELTFLMELQDSMTGHTLARAADATRPNGTASADPAADWESVRVAAERWAGLFRAFLDANLGTAGPG